MKIRTIGKSHIFINNFTKYGKKRNKFIKAMTDKGCKIIKEYHENCNSRVYLGYINEYVQLANYAVRICRDGSYEEKYTKGVYSPFPSSMKTFYISKVKQDKNGNITTLERTIQDKNDKVILNEQNTSSNGISLMKNLIIQK